MEILLLALGLTCLLVVFAEFFTDKLPDELFYDEEQQKTMRQLTLDLEIAKNRFNEAVTKEEIEAAIYELNTARKKLMILELQGKN